jgi:hypothetical protein
MKPIVFALGILCMATPPLRAADAPAAAPDWAMNATIIEACSCPMFCQCYFATKPASHGEGHEHFCRFNNAFKVNKGHHGATKLDGVMFWIGGDLGAEFADGEMDWAVLTFDKKMTKEQRDGVAAIMGALYPVKWKSFTTAEGAMEWQSLKEEAIAMLDGGKTGIVKLKKFQGMTNDPVVIKNLKYWGAPRNDGFVLMPSEQEMFQGGGKPFDYKGTNGFMITFDITSKDVPPKS